MLPLSCPALAAHPSSLLKQRTAGCSRLNELRGRRTGRILRGGTTKLGGKQQEKVHRLSNSSKREMHNTKTDLAVPRCKSAIQATLEKAGGAVSPHPSLSGILDEHHAKFAPGLFIYQATMETMQNSEGTSPGSEYHIDKAQ